MLNNKKLTLDGIKELKVRLLFTVWFREKKRLHIVSLKTVANKSQSALHANLLVMASGENMQVRNIDRENINGNTNSNREESNYQLTKQRRRQARLRAQARGKCSVMIKFRNASSNSTTDVSTSHLYLINRSVERQARARYQIYVWDLSNCKVTKRMVCQY